MGDYVLTGGTMGTVDTFAKIMNLSTVQSYLGVLSAFYSGTYIFPSRLHPLLLPVRPGGGSAEIQIFLD